LWVYKKFLVKKGNLNDEIKAEKVIFLINAVVLPFL